MKYLFTRLAGWAGQAGSDDPAQDRALRRAARFFAAMLALTLLARGMAAAALPEVILDRAAPGLLTETVEAQGVIAAAGSLPVSLPAQLLIREVPVAAGQTVAAGETLAVVDTEQLDLAIREAEAALAGLEARLARLADAPPLDESALTEARRAAEWARQDYDRLLAQNEADPAALTAAGRALDSANAAVEQQRAACIRAQSELELAAREAAAEAAAVRLEREAAQKALAGLRALAEQEGRLTAPADGTILEIAMQPGHTAGPDTPAALLADPEAGVLVRFALDETQAEQACPGQTVRVTQGAQQADAALTALGTPDAEGRAEAVVRLSGGWRCGPAGCSLTLSSRQYALVLPAGAVTSDAAGSCVYQVEQRTTLLGPQQVLVRLPVTVLASAGGRVAVEGSFAPDAQLVLASTGALTDGGRVKVIA